MNKYFNGKHNKSLPDKKKVVFFSEFRSLLDAGLDFSGSFRLLIESDDDQKMSAVLENVYNRMIQGETLNQAMHESGGFSSLDHGVIRIGEETGRISDALDFLYRHYANKIRVRRMISSALSYPMIVFTVSVAVVIFMMAVIVPMFEQVYSRMGGELPAITRKMIAASEMMPRIISFIGILAAVTAALVYRYRKAEGMRKTLASIVINTPLVGKLVVKNYQSRFCKLMHLLCGAGVPLLDGLTLVRELLVFYPFSTSILNMSLQITEGKLFYESIKNYESLYGKKMVTLVKVGEETNSLFTILGKYGSQLEEELEHSIRENSKFIEPVLILLVGSMIAVILISMYLPMFKMGGVMI